MAAQTVPISTQPTGTGDPWTGNTDFYSWLNKQGLNRGIIDRVGTDPTVAQVYWGSYQAAIANGTWKPGNTNTPPQDPNNPGMPDPGYPRSGTDTTPPSGSDPNNITTQYSMPSWLSGMAQYNPGFSTADFYKFIQTAISKGLQPEEIAGTLANPQSFAAGYSAIMGKPFNTTAPAGPTNAQGIDAQIAELQQRLASGNYNAGQLYEFQAKLQQLNQIKQGMNPAPAPTGTQFSMPSQYATPTTFGGGNTTATNFGIPGGTQTGLSATPNPNDPGFVAFLKSKGLTDQEVQDTLNTPNGLSTMWQQYSATQPSSSMGYGNLAQLTQFQDPNTSKAFDPQQLNAYYDLTRGNLTAQQGQASSQAANRAGALAASRGLLNPGAVQNAAASQVAGQYSGALGDLMANQAGALQQQSQNLYGAQINQQTLQEQQRQAALADLFNRQQATEQSRQYGQNNLLQSQAATEAARQAQLQNIFNNTQATEASRQFNVGQQYNQNAFDFNKGLQLAGAGQAYSSNNPDIWGNLLKGLLSGGTALLGNPNLFGSSKG